VFSVSLGDQQKMSGRQAALILNSNHIKRGRVGFKGLGRGRFLAPLSLVLFVLFVFANVGQVWADTINPNPPIAGQPLTISGNGGGGFGILYAGSGCPVLGGITAVFDPSPGPFTDNFPAQAAGQYSFSHQGDPSGCVNFTIIQPGDCAGLSARACLVLVQGGYRDCPAATREKN
jgi:hypothetical protein